RQHHVHERHDRPVHPRPEVASPQPQQHADRGGHQHGGHPDQERHAPPVNHAREQVTPDLIGAEHVVGGTAIHPRRRRQPVPDVHLHWAVGSDPRRRRRDADDQQHEDGGHEAPLEPPEPGPRSARGRGRGAGGIGRAPALEPHLARVDRAHAPTRMRGSMSPTIMSTRKLTATMSSARSTTAHWTTGKSWLRIDSTVSVATPGHAKTVSVMMAPPSSWPNCRPSTVMTGMQALRNACFTTTRPSASPLARAVLMNSMFMTSITPERTSRMVMGASAAPRQNAG